MKLLHEEIKSRFADINDYLSKEMWMMDPYISSIKDVAYLGCEDELCELQADSVSKKYFQENGYERFWIVKGHTVAPILAKPRLFSHLVLPTCLRQPSVPL